MDYHYDSMNHGGYELPAWSFQEGDVPETIDPTLLFANSAEECYGAQEGEEGQ
ncbi:hypothetical protein MMC18_000261 [Xylographa bjoerkii]|nr:hypothetical protein [Xylographa bjoerkii]